MLCDGLLYGSLQCLYRLQARRHGGLSQAQKAGAEDPQVASGCSFDAVVIAGADASCVLRTAFEFVESRAVDTGGYIKGCSFTAGTPFHAAVELADFNGPDLG